MDSMDLSEQLLHQHLTNLLNFKLSLLSEMSISKLSKLSVLKGHENL